MFYKYFKAKLEGKTGAKQVLGDPCTWIWQDSEGKLIGWCSVHVDDVIMAGCLTNPAWLAVRAKIESLYRWGVWKRTEFRFAGVDVKQNPDTY